MKSLLKKFRQPHLRVLFSNFSYLLILEVLNRTLGLITLPYLLRVIGVEHYGILAFATATLSYFALIIDYGFNLTATREVAINRGNQQKLTEIFSAVISIRLGLVLLSFVLLFLMVTQIPFFVQHRMIYLYSFGATIGGAFFPVWFFQGMEKMKFITFFNVISKGAVVPLIFLLIKEPADFYWVPIFYAAASIAIALLSLLLVRFKFGIRFKFQRFKTLHYYWKQAHTIFITNVAISLYLQTNVFLLGLLTNNQAVGIYSAADRIVTGVNSILTPISQSLFPHISKKIESGKENTLSFIRKVLRYLAPGILIISLLLCLFAKTIVELIYGHAVASAIPVLRIMAFLPLIVLMSNIFGIQTMIAFNHKKPLQRIVVWGGIINLLLLILLIPPFAETGAAISLLLIESYITIACINYVQKSDLKLIVYKPFKNLKKK